MQYKEDSCDNNKIDTSVCSFLKKIKNMYSSCFVHLAIKKKEKALFNLMLSANKFNLQCLRSRERHIMFRD